MDNHPVSRARRTSPHAQTPPLALRASCVPSRNKCGQPKPVENAEIASGSGGKLRYSCIRNYKRQAGTSSLILCKQDEATKEFRWTEAQLKCIRDPSLPDPPPEATTEDSRRETASSTPSAPEATSAAPSAAPLHPHGSGTASQPASDPASTPPGTASLPSPSPSSPSTATAEAGRCCPATATAGVTRPPSTSPPASQAPASTMPGSGDRGTSAPAGRIPGNATRSSDKSVRQGITGSPYFRIGFPFLVLLAVIIICFVLWVLYRRPRCSLRWTGIAGGTDFPQRVLAPTMSEGGGQIAPSGNGPEDSGAAPEGMPMLPMGAQGATSTG
ncbi:interleukin-15 receptor subunit alpha [Varanus komodoensis]|uniref:interleukin-15 receptor subunit alpha n=1 Tax=Varanus komodoensis TaxID=61221 RepID=UPI001CF7AF83|nr:interleukin-15 receptor subunit alpha [Varanus komodoensis]